jgi:hypothetical protein
VFKSGHFHQRPEVHKTRNSKPHRRTVTVTATDYEFQRAVLCCLAAGWSQSPSTLMQSPGMGSTAHVPVCASRLMQSPACIKHLCMRLLNVRHHLVPITLRAGVPASTVQCRWEASRCWQQACMVPKAWQVLGMCSVPKPLLYLVQGCAGSARTTLWAVVKTR